MNFREFFAEATGGREPYPFQERFAEADFLPHLVRAPTGAGKTATAILGWLWRRQTKKQSTPRRLVYCLPMRVLVEQSEREAKKWIENLNLDVPIRVLMGGIDTEDWHLHPETPAILIGTQDMLLSRALNRGYAASRFHWPIDFGLLNNDCLWVFDEPQLMAAGVSTSAQLAGLRQSLGCFGNCQSVWMSATLEPCWLDTIDLKSKFNGEPLELTKDDYSEERLMQRMEAEKTLHACNVASSKDMKEVARWILGSGDLKGVHQPGTQTLVVLNTVDRAKAAYDELLKLRKKSETPALLLIHSRFRPQDRQQLNEQLQQQESGDRVIVATQVVEAGVDISARTLITELAPWASVVQRIGRCNRTGDDGPGQVFWINLDEKLSPPYLPADLEFARAQLTKLSGNSVSPKALDEFKTRENITLPFEHKHVLRRRDLLDLFDTTPDLSGNDIDIQRFVRSDDPDTDVQVFWRDVAAQDEDVSPIRNELCNVPIGSIKAFLKKDTTEGFLWDHLDERWKAIRNPDREIFPGQRILLPTTVGGYSHLGWDPDSKSSVTPLPPEVKVPEEGAQSDLNSAVALTIAQHTSNVCDELGDLLKEMGAEVLSHRDKLMKAARWHDVGKAHQAFQDGVRSVNPALALDQLWAKSGKSGRLRYKRKYFRHELASALAALQQKLPFDTAYLVAAHHGRARLAIRALPGEDEPDDITALFALGIHHGDTLPEVDLGDEKSPAVTLDLSPMQLGGDGSWTAKALKLLDELGPFKLAYLEALLRAADVRASKKEVGRE